MPNGRSSLVEAYWTSMVGLQWCYLGGRYFLSQNRVWHGGTKMGITPCRDRIFDHGLLLDTFEIFAEVMLTKTQCHQATFSHEAAQIFSRTEHNKLSMLALSLKGQGGWERGRKWKVWNKYSLKLSEFEHVCSVQLHFFVVFLPLDTFRYDACAAESELC